MCPEPPSPARASASCRRRSAKRRSGLPRRPPFRASPWPAGIGEPRCLRSNRPAVRAEQTTGCTAAPTFAVAGTAPCPWCRAGSAHDGRPRAPRRRPGRNPPRPSTLPQHLEKTQIDVDGLVLRAVERPGSRLPETAGSLRSAAEHHQPGWSVPGVPTEYLGPGVLGAGEHGRHEAAARIGRRHAMRTGKQRRRGCLHHRPSLSTPPIRPRISSGLTPNSHPPTSATRSIPIPMPPRRIAWPRGSDVVALPFTSAKSRSPSWVTSLCRSSAKAS